MYKIYIEKIKNYKYKKLNINYKKHNESTKALTKIKICIFLIKI